MQRMVSSYRMALVIAGVFFQKTLPAQERLLHGRVLDADDRGPVARAHVSAPHAQGGAVTDEDGRFALRWTGVEPVALRVSHVAYGVQDVPIAKRMRSDDAPCVLLVARRGHELGGVTIRPGAPEVVYQHPELHVGDYVVDDRGIWVLAYARPQLWHRADRVGERLYREARLHLLDTAFIERASCAIPGKAGRLHRDHAGRILVEGEERAWTVRMDSGAIVLSALSLEMLRTAVLPWTDSIPGKLLGNDRNDHWPAFRHFAHTPGAPAMEVICIVEDKHVMSLFRSQYKYMSGADKVKAMNMEHRLGVDREIIAGYMTGFQHDPYFRVPYAPLFLVGDTLCVFDHPASRLRKYDMDLRPCGDRAIAYHMEKGWRQAMAQDRSDGRVHVLHRREGLVTLRAVDTGTGELQAPSTIARRFPEEVTVHGGHVYYVHRPPGGTERRTLYREALGR